MPDKKEERKRAPYIAINYGCNMNCGYCLTAMNTSSGKFMSLPDAELISRWLVDQKITDLGLLGGEPTMHPQFKDITRLFGEHGLKLSIPTNALFNEGKKEAFEMGVYKLAIVHLNDDYFYRKGEFEIIKENAKFLADCGLEVEIRYVVHMPAIPERFIYEFADFISATTVNFSIARPDASGGAFYLPVRTTRLILPEVYRSVRFFRDHGFQSSISAALLPLCVISGYEDAFMSGEEGFCSRNNGKFDSSIVINPDLTADVCTSVPISTGTKRVVDFLDLDDVKSSLEARFENLRVEPLFSDCLTCPDFNTRCQGGCLVYKYLKYKS